MESIDPGLIVLECQWDGIFYQKAWPFSKGYKLNYLEKNGLYYCKKMW